MKTQHTDGPWVVFPGPGLGIGGINRGFVASCTLRAEPEEMKANAALIAAAPDLLSALKNLLQERYVDGDESDQEFDARGNWTCNSPASISARAAIAKARGDQ